MTGRPCGICGAATVDTARYCTDCGAPLDAIVVELDRYSGREPGRADRVVTSKRPSRILITAVAAVVAMVGIALLTVPGSDDTAAPRPRPTPDGTLRNDAPRPVPSPTPTERPAPTPRPGPTRAAPPTPVAADDLPPMEATHLAVLGRDRLDFLDLGTGTWSTSSGWSSRSDDARAVRGGVVAQADGSWVFAPVEGGEVTVVVDTGGLVLVGGALIVTAAFDEDAARLEALRFDGTVAWTAQLPDGTWPIGVTDRGEVIAQFAERIVAIDGAAGTRRPVATGMAVTIFDDDVVLWSCDATLRCATSQLDLATGAATVLSDRQMWLEPLGPGRFIGYPQGGGEIDLFAVTDDGLVGIDDEVPVDARRYAADASGVIVELGIDTLGFTTPTGDVTTITAPPAAGPNAVLRLIGPG